MNKQIFCLSLTERIFIKKSANTSVCYCVARYENFVVNQKTSIFVSYVIEEFANAFSCVYIELWRALKKLELHSAISSCNSYASFMLSKLPARIHNSIYTS